jgi:hypothetical protein
MVSPVKFRFTLSPLFGVMDEDPDMHPFRSDRGFCEARVP